MTKFELLKSLAALPFCTRLVGAYSKIGIEGDVPVYRQAYIEVVEDRAMVKAVDFYVLDEGKPAEAAYYLQGRQPESTVADQLTQERAAKAAKGTVG